MACSHGDPAGVESGFAVVRSARQGLLTVSDRYGRIVDVTASGSAPVATLEVREKPRVVLACLKIAGGNVAKLRREVFRMAHARVDPTQPYLCARLPNAALLRTQAGTFDGGWRAPRLPQSLSSACSRTPVVRRITENGEHDTNPCADVATSCAGPAARR